MRDLPSTPSDPLADRGFDSLLFVMAVVEIEKEFSVRVPAEKATPEAFRNLATLEELLISMGVA